MDEDLPMFDEEDSEDLWRAFFGLFAMSAFTTSASKEEKTLKRTDTPLYSIDTCEVVGLGFKYQCAIAHNYYNKGGWVILGYAPDKNSALMMHLAYEHMFKSVLYPPKSIVDVDSHVRYHCDILGDHHEQ